MHDDRSLRLVLAACHSALTDARAGLIQIAGAVPELERICAAIQAELDVETAPG